jgi:uncharacterized protein
MDASAPPASSYAPVVAGERLATLDVLRGFALLGIALMNVEYFTRPLQGMMLGLDPTLEGLDRGVGWAITAFVQGKFWTLFSLLFGMGFALMLQRADALRADPDFSRVYLRRLGTLLVIGLLHATLLWAGDILVPYAIAGFVLLLIARNIETPMLWRIGLLLYLVPLGLLWPSVALYELVQRGPDEMQELAQAFTESGAELRREYALAELAYRDGSWGDAVRQRVADSLDQYALLALMLPAIIGVFLIGAWFVRSGTMRDVDAHRARFRRLLWIGAPLGTALVLGAMQWIEGADRSLPTFTLGLGETLMHAGGLVLCLAYLSALVLANQRWPRLQAWLAPVGRMALSNYLLQSAVFSTLFYGYGLGAWGQVSRAQQVLLVLALFALQVLLSRLWLARFRYGPIEWLWRAATYGRLPTLQR